MTKTVHLVCLDAPSPPDYGGAIDMYCKIRALADIGLNVILHYFDYKPHRNAHGLKPYCQKVYSYKRLDGLHTWLSRKPYIISSRVNPRLIEKLNKDNFPVILEGLHCAGIIPYLNKREKTIIRIHNDEATYYERLKTVEKNLFKKIYFGREAALLHHFQQTLNTKQPLACLSQTDMITFQKVYGCTNVHYIPCFIPWQSITSLEGMGDYCLYHGNLAVAENEQAAHWLIANVFSQVKYRLIIAGKGASQRFGKISRCHPNIELVDNPTEEQMEQLIKNAHINVLPSLNRTGVKLKLLHAAFCGRYCITNQDGVEGSGMTQGIHIAQSAGEYIHLINDLMTEPFTAKESKAREHLLNLYNNRQNAQKLSTLL